MHKNHQQSQEIAVGANKKEAVTEKARGPCMALRGNYKLKQWEGPWLKSGSN